jgi:hypothetical protein
MKNNFLTLLIVICASMSMATSVQARPQQPPPLQPVGEQGLTDFTDRINDPDSPGNAGLEESHVESVFQEPAEEPEVINEDTSVNTDDNSNEGASSFPVAAVVSILIIIAAIAGGHYWYKTRKTK